jgi:hypothetical protein
MAVKLSAAGYPVNEHVSLTTDNIKTIQELLETMFSMSSLPRLNKQLSSVGIFSLFEIELISLWILERNISPPA